MTYLPNLSKEDPAEDSEGCIYYFNSTLEDLCPFLLNDIEDLSSKGKPLPHWGRGRGLEISFNFRLRNVLLCLRWMVYYFHKYNV
jgi:hypothetical protein